MFSPFLSRYQRQKVTSVRPKPFKTGGRGLPLSPCCPLLHTGQDSLPPGRLDSSEESRRSSSTRLLCSWWRQTSLKQRNTFHFACLSYNPTALKAAKRTWWSPGRSGRPPWLPCAGRAVWRTCRAGRRWHWPRAPCRSGSGWMRTTSCDNDKKKTQRKSCFLICVAQCTQQLLGTFLKSVHHKKTEAED